MFRLSQRAAESLMDAARLSPDEICGLIGADGKMWMVPNIHPFPKLNFVMDTRRCREIYESHDVIGCFHSHPSGDERLSDTDIRYATEGLQYWLVTPDSVTEWRIEGSERSAEPRSAHLVDTIRHIPAEGRQGDHQASRAGL